MQLHCQTTTDAAANVTVIDDIRNAFRGITNDSELVDHIIPEMYGPSMRSPNPLFVFKMPTQSTQEGGSRFELLTMQRSDFSEPIFPNVTASSPVLEIDSGPVAPETSVKTSLVPTPQIQWQQLGLEGWVGELKPPAPWLEESHK